MKNNKNKKNIDISIIIIIVTVVIVLLTIIMRHLSYTETWVVCEKDITTEYHEILKFRYDADNNLYGYYREELVHDVSAETLEQNRVYFNDEYEKVKDDLNDNFDYRVIVNDDNILVKTYISVKIYPGFFNDYIASNNISNTSTASEITDKLTSASYTCNTTRK